VVSHLSDAWTAAVDIESLAREVIHSYEELHLLYGLGETVTSQLVLSEQDRVIGLMLEKILGTIPASEVKLSLANDGAVFRRPAGSESADLDNPIQHDLLEAALKSGGQVVGTLSLYRPRDRQPFSSADRMLLEAVSTLVANAIQSSQLYQQRRRSEEALRETNLRLEQALATVQQMQQNIIQQERLRALGQMASGIAHDFNNSLATIVGFTDLLLSRPEYFKSSEKAKSFLQMIATAAGDATKVVERLREFYRRRDEANFLVPVNLNEIVDQAILLTEPKWRYQAQAEGLDIRIEADLRVSELVPANAAELREALTNLILNAVDAMPTGGVLTIRTDHSGSHALLQVCDTGTGMSEEVRRRCLEPFFTTKGERGSGLGLSLVYGVVDRLGGAIEIDSGFGRGTAITITLPLERAASVPSVGGLRRLGAVKPQRILVVEDRPTIRQMLVEYLTLDGHTVEVTTNGREGASRFLEATSRARPADAYGLVITDLAMPEMSGAQLARMVKAVAPVTPVILLTGFGDILRTAGEQPPSVDLIVPKPVSLNGLRAAITRVLEPDQASQDKKVG
jgi:signal transduction histidine kinase/ActR/RegA family two-component response regulator